MFKKIPLEIYFIFLPGFIVSVIMKSSTKSDSINVEDIQNINPTLGDSYTILMYGLGLLLTYILYSVSMFIYRKQIVELRKLLFSLLYISLSICLTMILVFNATSIIFSNISPSKIAPVGDALMRIDYFLFGTYSGALVQHIFSNEIIRAYIIFCYMYLLPVITCILSIAFFINTRAFRTGLLSFCLSFCIAIPIWIVNPTLSPLNMYGDNRAFSPESSYAQDFTHFKTGGSLQKNRDILGKAWMPEDNSWYSVSANPSMHIAWGLIFVFVAYMIWKPFGLLTGIWFLGDAVGTLLLFQHYFIDLLSGALVALISVSIISYVLKKPIGQEHDLFYLPRKIQSDIKNLLLPIGNVN